MKSSSSNKEICSFQKDLYGGWLSKKGRGRGLAGLFGFFRPWALRFVTVNIVTGILTYYNNQEDAEAKRDENGHMHLKKAEITGKEKQFIMEVLLQQEVSAVGLNGEKSLPGEGERLAFRALDLEHYKEWVSIISTAAR